MTELVAFVKDPLDFMLDGGIIVNRVHRAFSHRSINPVQRVSAATAFSAGAVKEKIELMGFVGHEGSSIQEPTRTSYASWAIHRRNRSHIRSRQYVLRFSNSQKVVVQ